MTANLSTVRDGDREIAFRADVVEEPVVDGMWVAYRPTGFGDIRLSDGSGDLVAAHGQVRRLPLFALTALVGSDCLRGIWEQLERIADAVERAHPDPCRPDRPDDDIPEPEVMQVERGAG